MKIPHPVPTLVAAVVLASMLPFGLRSNTEPDPFRDIAEGMALAEFERGPDGEQLPAPLVVVRVDPSVYTFRILTSSETGVPLGLPVRAWCEEFGLVAGINAGMFQEDRTTHVGYLKAGDHVNSARPNRYQSVAAFDPIDSTAPPFRLFDLEIDSLGAIVSRYRSVVQNLRLIKRPGENRWEQQDKRWSEAALGEDTEGRALLIFSRTPFSMHDLNEFLLSLPIGLVAAQHLEGGAQAQLFVRGDSTVLDLVGHAQGWPVPNVIGLVRTDPRTE